MSLRGVCERSDEGNLSRLERAEEMGALQMI